MKIIKDNSNNSANIAKEEVIDVLKIHCENCESELEITKKDTYVGYLGLSFITCPCCGKESAVYELDAMTLTKDNVEFPTHFHRANKELGAVEVTPDEIKKEIQRGIDFLRNNKDQYHWYISYGELFLVIFKYSGDENYFIVVTKDFYEADISFEAEDF